MIMSQRVDTLQFLAGSPHRVAVLRSLNDGAERSRVDLFSEIEASRRTVKRTLEEFDERGWILETDDGLSLTVGGAFVLDAYENFIDRANLVADLRPFVSLVTKEDCYAGPAAFEGARVIEMDAAFPYAPVEYFLDRYREATERAHIVLTYVSVGILERIGSAVSDRDLDLTVVIDESVRKAIETTPEYYDLFEEHAGDVDLYALDEGSPFWCAIIDEHALLTVTDDDGLPSVLLSSANPAFVEVIEGRFREEFERAEPLAMADIAE